MINNIKKMVGSFHERHQVLKDVNLHLEKIAGLKGYEELKDPLQLEAVKHIAYQEWIRLNRLRSN